MTPKKQAEKLLSEYLIYFPEYYNDLEYDYNIEKAKKCALIAVDEILDTLGGAGVYGYADKAVEHYWQEVKQEIEKL